MTGAAATEIGGTTTASEFGYMRKNSHATQADIEDFADTRMNIIDEISFADYRNVLTKTSHNLQLFTNENEFVYGSIAMVFLGDFCQLETISGDCIYKVGNADGYLWGGCLNCMVELKGTHRYAGCPILKQIIPHMREHGLSAEHRALLNTRVINKNGVKMPDPATTRYATYTNVKRCQINADVFKSYLEKNHKHCKIDDICPTAIVIKADAHWTHLNGRALSFAQRKRLFEECSEANIKNTRSKRCDPLLCLFDGCHLMGNVNSDVANGIANGTTCTLKHVVLKAGKRPHPIRMHDCWVNAVEVSDVKHMELNFHDSSQFVGRFRIIASKATYKVVFPVMEQGRIVKMKTTMDLTQFPIVVNHATTGHKLQGKTLDRLVIAQWSEKKNWSYVAISRVRTLGGLYLKKAIPDGIDFSPPKEYLNMMSDLRARILANPTDHNLEEM